MKRTLFLFFCLGFYLGLSIGDLKAATPEMDKKFSDQVNLALRQVGHQLLKLACDERSTVPPVQITGSLEFTLKMETNFNYDTLPHLLNQAFLSYDIQRNYQVVIKSCDDNTTILGYNQLAFSSGDVPCIGRDQQSECNNIVLIFAAPVGPLTERQRQFIILFVVAIAVFGLGVYWQKNKTPVGSRSSVRSVIPLGKFNFDPRNQTLQLNDQQQSLTFRENKLLYFLVNNANKVVNRDTLLAEVWGDEGVIVGRSLDVFISRLRKILKEDQTVMIKNIHGVGYRLEVAV